MSAEPNIQPESLPEAYYPFLPVLERLTEPMLKILHGHLMSLEAMLRSVQSQSKSVKGDFEGIGGLTPRGDINRIIQSELLLRSEVPLEFLRRVSEGEALYMETEHTNPDEQIVYRVIISVGPYMLGHGRLLALASLIFLARAAQSRNAKLHWTYLPTDKQVNWFEGLSVNSVKRFLKFASFRDVTAEDIDGAIEQWDAFNVSLDPVDSVIESWLIAATGSADHSFESGEAENALILTLDLPPIDGARAGTVDLRRKGRNIRRLIVEFPADNICVSALNRPFNPEKITSDPGAVGVGSFQKGEGWEPCHVLSADTHNHVVRVRNGLLFLTFQRNFDDKVKSVFFEMPSDAKVAGVHFPTEYTGQILSQWNSPDENIYFHDLNMRKAKIIHRSQKTITSKHLFMKQRRSALPPMIANYQMVKSYTTLGQPFEFSGIRTDNAGINILYKENRIIYADAKYAIVLLDPSKKSSEDLKNFAKHMPLDDPSLSFVVLKNHSKIVAVYPCPDEAVFNNFRGLCYSPSSHNLACALQDGNWLIMGQNSEEFHLSLSPYERLLRCHMSHGRCKAIVFSDPKLGGDNTLMAISSVNGSITGHETLYKFDRISSQLENQNLVELRMLINGGLRAVNLDENGNPDKLILLRKFRGQQRPQIIDLEAEITTCDHIAYGVVHA